MAESDDIKGWTEEAMPIGRELSDALLKDSPDQEDILAEDGRLKHLTTAVSERGLETAWARPLGSSTPARQGHATATRRQGQSQKPRKGEQGQIDREVPRDRQGPCEPQLVPQGQTRLDGLDEQLSARCARQDHARSASPPARTRAAWRSRPP